MYIKQKVQKVGKHNFTREAFWREWGQNDQNRVSAKIVERDILQHHTEVLERNKAWQLSINGEM